MSVAQLVYLKKPAMAEAAERLRADKRWLPNVLRLPQLAIEKNSPPTFVPNAIYFAFTMRAPIAASSIWRNLSPVALRPRQLPALVIDRDER
ncbi:hypothetical protein I6F36_35295 [Bradyrhizobium sp. BRP19]|uniref:hypothetical protein n=1 Tax=Bradyrhizobium sp. BRP19 TaxID=2793823 RepID=UPI001CD291E4|nr:hypothetical protein [Bradyrhizobium sp. BRP19]MCA1552063.1 hypothetical protein [Bradyrhizobium sp. BRP19]